MHLAHYAHFVAILIWGLSTLMVVFLFKTAQYGARLHEQNVYGLVMLQRHRWWAWRSVWLTAVTVLVIESVMRIFKLPHPRFFWYVHFPLLVLYPSFLVLALVFDGQTEMKNFLPQHPGRHNQFGRAAWRLGLATALTGDYLVFILLWLPFCGR